MANPPKHLEHVEEKSKLSYFRHAFGFLKRWDSLFYFALFSLILGFLWIGYSLVENSFTQLLNWDYTWQYVPFSYTYWDAWHSFFRTGVFPQYDFSTWIGTDQIGSNSYYGLFDPFTIALTLFPRAWIPQMMAVMTAFKMMVATLLTRCYLKYMGIKEWTARFAALAAGFSGYVSFFVGFPTFLSAACYIPMILWGIEKVIRERKCGILVWALFLEGITSFFLLVVACIFGVCYALWRFFWTIKSRNAKQNIVAMVMGVAAFAVGLMLCSFTLIPSVRESSLSGRSVSIGTAYFSAIKTSLFSRDLRSFFSLIFEPVGDNPGRELMGLLSFFFPTGGHYALPLARSGYDAWTSALFLYTPCVILFFVALIQSIRLHRVDHLLAVVLIAFLLFTNFSYFFFYAFSGNGYGRWYLVLIPIIAYYCAWAFDQRETSPRWIPVAGGVLALAGTVGSFFLCDLLLKGQSFYDNPNNLTYWQSSYVSASDTYNGNIYNCWYLYYQIALVAFESVLLVVGQKKKWLPHALVIAVAIEAVVMGNIAYSYDGLWNYEYWFAGGSANRDTISYVADRLKARDSSFYRTYADCYQGNKYTAKVAGLNASADFHSLMNFDAEDFALMNHMKKEGSTIYSSYGSSGIYNASWSGYYANKREGTDSVIGYRYYQISNSYSAWKDFDDDTQALFLTPNVPFGSEEIVNASPNRDTTRVYGVSEDYRPSLGWAVNSNELYALKKSASSNTKSNFYSGSGGLSGFKELLRAEDVEQYGAAIGTEQSVPSGFVIKGEIPSIADEDVLRLGHGLNATYYKVGNGNLMVPSSQHSYYHEGLGFFLNHSISQESITSTKEIVRDSGMVAFTPSEGTYFNEDDGVYFEFKYYNNLYFSGDLYDAVPRIYVIGDSYNEDGTLRKENDLLSFEYNAIDNARKCDDHSYYGYSRSTFGLYAMGKAKAIVFCFTGSSSSPNIRFDPTNFYVRQTNFTDWKAKQDVVQKDKLQDVAYSTNLFTFKTQYDADRIVLTQLGYDAGWQAKAKLPNGSTVDCSMLKLDGGLVGFVAPHVLDEQGNPLEISYELRYQTPYAGASSLLWVAGVLAFSGYLGFGAYQAIRMHKKKEESLRDAPRD